MLDYFKESFLGVFLNGFCVSLVRPGILIFLALVLSGKLGAGIGLPILFWRPRDVPKGSVPVETKAAPWPQFLVGIGIGALIWQVLLAGYIFEEFATNYTLDRPPFCEVRPGKTSDSPASEKLNVKVDLDGMKSRNILGYTLDFPPVHRDFTGRFRLEPRSWLSMAYYSSAVLVGGFVIGSLLLIGWMALAKLLTRLFVAAPTWKKFEIPSKQASLPWSPWLPAGIVAGTLALSAVTWFECNALETSAKKTGQVMTTFADWGSSAGRQAVVKSHIPDPKPPKGIGEKKAEPILADEVADARSWFAPYYAVYGAFVFNFVLIAGVSIAMMWFPIWLGFTPSVGILLLLQILIAANTLLNYFSPIPAEFAVIVLAGIVLFSGRAYKLKFPNMGTLYDSPVPLKNFYLDRAKAEAVQTGVGPGGANAAAAPAPVPQADLIRNEPWQNFGYTQPGRTTAAMAAASSGGSSANARKPKLAIVCVSGGGSRAAAWTMKSLLEIEKAFAAPGKFARTCVDDPKTALEAAQAEPDKFTDSQLETLRRQDDFLKEFGAFEPIRFPYQVRLVTGASGGMIAAAHYVASLAAPNGKFDNLVNRNPVRKKKGEAATPLDQDDLFEGICQDFLTPVAHTLFTRDIPSLLLSSHLGKNDRGASIEEAWKTSLYGQLDKTVKEMRQGEEDSWRPSLIFSPMMIEDGRQLFISNLDLAPVVRNTAMVLGETDALGNANSLNPFLARCRRLLSREGMEFFKAFPSATGFKLSTAARMSASFPYVLPAAYLPTNPPRRVVDAGYYDNYGVGIASSWIFNNIDLIEKHTSGVVVIQIRDGISGASRRRETPSDSFPGTIETGLHWLTSPPQGIWSFRQAAHTFRNDNLLHQLCDVFAARKHAPGFFSTVSFEFQEGDDVALNFTLTEGERASIKNAVESPGFKIQLKALLEWWHR